MEQRIEQDVEGWPTRPFEDGYDGLRQLAAADFSGVVRAGGAWLFFVNGKIVGIFEGEIEDVDGSQGTAHKAPHPSLPLLYAMQATGGDTRAKYYTNDTPISEVHDTLSSGAFTGYVELSENVLSGDYYQLFHGGRSMSVAFVGNSGRMITGDEAFERADDEVGIYEVVDVDVEVTDVPQPSGGDDADESEDATEEAETDSEDDAATSDDDAAASEDAGEPDDAGEPEDATPATASSTDAPTSTESAPEPTATESTGSVAAESAAASESDDGESAADAGDAPSGATATGSTDESPPATESSADGDAGTRAADASAGETTRSESDGSRGARGSAADGAGTQGSGRATTPDRAAAVSESSTAVESADEGAPHFQNEATWQEATTVPSLDPDRSEDGEPDARGGSGGGQRGRRRQSRRQSSQQARQQSRKQSRRRSQQRQSGREQSSSSRSQEVDDTLEEEVLEREDRIDRLQQRVENFEEEREELADERDRLADRVESLTEENESLRGEIRQLEQEIETLEAATVSGAGGQSAQPATDEDGDVALAPRAALEGTDLFVRYDSKSEPTLDAAHGGSADRAAVNQNLRLDVHTQFQEEGATVDGESFHDFLEQTMAYRFVEWLVRALPYEIRETGSESALRDLYDALPEIDRVEFHGDVARDAVEGEEGAPSETFDVVVRDKMGEALFVANMNESRDPATGRMIVDLEEAASRVKEHSMALAGAFVVTRSFFEPAALETTSEATSGSLLSRDSRKSYVKLSRKQGYHLCLVEARGDDLHLNVPEL